MKKIIAVLIAALFVTVILPLAIVFVMDKTIDNSPPEPEITAAPEAAQE